MIYNLEGKGPYPVAMAVSVPKRLFRKAVDRNLIKRRIREAYRVNKTGLYEGLTGKGKTIDLVIQYQIQEIASFKTIEGGLVQGIKTLLLRLEESGKISG